MKKKDLAPALGISASMVSRLARQGMPTDSAEGARRWRECNLEPGRMKGVRFGAPSAPPVSGIRERLAALRALVRASEPSIYLSLSDWLLLVNYCISPVAKSRLQNMPPNVEPLAAEGFAHLIHGANVTAGDSQRWFIAATDPYDMADAAGNLLP